MYCVTSTGVLAGDDVLAVEARDVHEVVRARREHAEAGRRRRPRRGQPQEIDVLHGLQRLDDGRRREGVETLGDVHEGERGDPAEKSEVFSFVVAEALLARRLHVGEVLLEPREVLHVHLRGVRERIREDRALRDVLVLPQGLQLERSRVSAQRDLRVELRHRADQLGGDGCRCGRSAPRRDPPAGARAMYGA